ncbi:hypothetical protein [Azospirillum brasilense]|uniref:hypothetical protein n=1 Tax=Azospirillum brasilense TaxID=192 RepID=UPI001177F408|nr:hypothetical protein [Azospirillum brasilense]
MALRDRVGQMLRPKVSAAIRQRAWLNRNENIPRLLAEDFIESTAWWLTHSSGNPVRAPRHARRIYLSPRHGWALDFGANTFLVGKALERCRTIIHSFYEKISSGDIPIRSEVSRALRRSIAGAVANYSGDEYTEYPDDGQDLVFGAQAIDLNDAVRFALRNSGLDEFLAHD